MSKKIGSSLLKKGCAKYNNLNFIRTDFRIEWLSKIKKNKNEKIKKMFKKKINQKNFIIIYSHENELKLEKNKHCLNTSAELLINNLGLKCLKP